MRRVFRSLERWDEEAARKLGLNWTDGRLRRLREEALRRLQANLAQSGGRGLDEASFLKAYQLAYRQAADKMGLSGLDPAAEVEAKE